MWVPFVKHFFWTALFFWNLSECDFLQLLNGYVSRVRMGPWLARRSTGYIPVGHSLDSLFTLKSYLKVLSLFKSSKCRFRFLWSSASTLGNHSTLDSLLSAPWYLISILEGFPASDSSLLFFYALLTSILEALSDSQYRSSIDTDATKNHLPPAHSSLRLAHHHSTQNGTLPCQCLLVIALRYAHLPMFSIKVSTILPFEGHGRSPNHCLIFNPFWLVGSF